VELTYEADEAFARIGPRFRKAVMGLIRWENYSNLAMVLRFAAGAMGIPFIPTRTMLGSDMIKRKGSAQNSGKATRRYPSKS
jgi:glutaconate CoA-transferase subunit A